MDYWRKAALGFILGVVLILLGFLITPPGMTKIECADSSKFIFKGTHRLYIVWNDGCNDHLFPLLTVLGVASIVVGSGYGLVATERRVR